MGKEVEKIRKKIETYLVFVLSSIFIWVSYNVFVWSYANVSMVREDGSSDKSIAFFVSFLLITILLFMFIAISMSLEDLFLQISLQKRFPTIHTNETLQENIFLEASLFMKHQEEKTDLQTIINKIKKRNVDVETSFLSSLHNQKIEKVNCSICEKEIELGYGTFINPCTCKSVRNYEKAIHHGKTTNSN